MKAKNQLSLNNLRSAFDTFDSSVLRREKPVFRKRCKTTSLLCGHLLHRALRGGEHARKLKCDAPMPFLQYIRYAYTLPSTTRLTLFFPRPLVAHSVNTGVRAYAHRLERKRGTLLRRQAPVPPRRPSCAGSFRARTPGASWERRRFPSITSVSRSVPPLTCSTQHISHE